MNTNPLNMDIGDEEEKETWIVAPEKQPVEQPATAPAVPAPNTTPAPLVPAGV